MAKSDNTKLIKIYSDGPSSSIGDPIITISDKFNSLPPGKRVDILIVIQDWTNGELAKLKRGE